MARVFVAGIPGTGKTHFGEWLRENRNYFHLDMEDGFRSMSELYEAWQKGMESDDFNVFVTLLYKLPPDLIMTWGFPPHAIHLAGKISEAGITPWWFDGDRDVARRLWAAREGHGDTTYFDYQCEQIDERWKDLQRFFGPNIIRVIESQDVRLSEEVIADRILAVNNV